MEQILQNLIYFLYNVACAENFFTQNHKEDNSTKGEIHPSYNFHTLIVILSIRENLCGSIIGCITKCGGIVSYLLCPHAHPPPQPLHQTGFLYVPEASKVQNMLMGWFVVLRCDPGLQRGCCRQNNSDCVYLLVCRYV